MHKNILNLFLIFFLVIVVLFSPHSQTIYNNTNLIEKKIDIFLRFYGLNKKSTIADFEQLLYQLLNKQEIECPKLSAELKNDIETLSLIFDQVGIKDDMKISQALYFIKNNQDIFQEKGINLFCFIRIYGHPGNGLPFFRLFKVLYGVWQLFWGGLEDNVIIYNPLIGYQHCFGRMCKETSGRFVGLITLLPPAIYTPTLPVTPCIIINGLFTLFSRSNVAFVPINNTSEKTTFPCDIPIYNNH